MAENMNEKLSMEQVESASESPTESEEYLQRPLPVKLMTRIDLHVVPTLAVLYLVCFLDRVNISNALLYGLPEDLNMYGNQVNLALALIFITYVLFEIPAAILMKKITPQRFLPGGLLALRLIMSIFEACIFPSCYYLLSMWYKREESQRRYSFFFVGCSLAGAFGGLIAYGIGFMDGQVAIERGAGFSLLRTAQQTRATAVEDIESGRVTPPNGQIRVKHTIVQTSRPAAGQDE